MIWLSLALLVLGVALLGAVGVRVLVGGVRPRPPGGADDGLSPHGAARRVLDERYASGELSTAEYEHRRRVLED